MKKLLSALIVLALATSVALASVPDPDECVVQPCDAMTCPRIVAVPDTDGSAFGDMTITVNGGPGLPLVGKTVEVWLNPACTNLFVCDELVLTDVTDANGQVFLNMNFGGCCDEVASVVIIADGVPIRQYDYVSSPDNNGLIGDGDVGLGDFITFGSTWGAYCTDMDGSCGPNIADFVAFGNTFGNGCID
jgi:hypothetical protein